MLEQPFVGDGFEAAAALQHIKGLTIVCMPHNALRELRWADRRFDAISLRHNQVNCRWQF